MKAAVLATKASTKTRLQQHHPRAKHVAWVCMLPIQTNRVKLANRLNFKMKQQPSDTAAGIASQEERLIPFRHLVLVVDREKPYHPASRNASAVQKVSLPAMRSPRANLVPQGGFRSWTQLTSTGAKLAHQEQSLSTQRVLAVVVMRASTNI